MHPSAIITRSCDVTDRALDKRFTRHRHRYGRRGSKSRANIRWSWNDSRPITTAVSNRSNPLRFIYRWWIPLERRTLLACYITILEEGVLPVLDQDQREEVVQQFFLVKFLIIRSFEKRIRIGVTKFDFCMQFCTQYVKIKILRLSRNVEEKGRCLSR